MLARMSRAMLLLLAACASCAAPPPAAAPTADRAVAPREIARELDDFHDAAAHADETRYFAHFAGSAVFLGSDRTEHWTLDGFRAYAHPIFAKGKGWTYKVERRTIELAPDGAVAWFDEDLIGERAGPTRGSGVLVRGAAGGTGGPARWLIAQYNLTVTVPNERYAAVRAAIDGPAPPLDLHARYKAAYARATTRGATDPAGARAELAPLVPEAKQRPDDELEFWLHNELTWVLWAEADLPAALAEVDQAKATLDHGIFADDTSRALRLHERWDRAYLLLETARAPTVKDRARAMAAADRARADYEELARPAKDVNGMAVLEAFFAARKGDGRAAVAAAKRVDLDKDDDLQDLYVIALALDAGGDRDGAAKVRAKVCSGRDYLMKPLLVRALAADGHPCAPAN
jgi:SnoaL-like domain